MKRFRWSRVAPLVLALTLLSSMFFSTQPISALVASPPAPGAALAAPKPPAGDQVTSGTVVVTPANLAGWRWMEEDSAAGGGMLAQLRMCCTKKLLWSSRLCIGTY